MKTGIELIAEERQEQIEKHGFTAEHHAQHPEWYEFEQLLTAAIRIVDYDKKEISSLYREMVPHNWDKEWWERLCDKPKFERIVIAGALIAAEIDRLQAYDPHLEIVSNRLCSKR